VNTGDAFDTQRSLERKALTNVRALVDKIEAEDRKRPWEAIRFGVLGTVVILGALGALAIWTPREQRPDDRKKTPAMTVAEYTEHCLRRIESVPKDKRLKDIRGLDGRVEISLTIEADGYLKSVEVTKSSFNSQVDATAGRIVKLAEPFGPLPDAVRKDAPVFSIRRVLHFDGSKSDSGSLTIERAPS
jgi:TonB family protein